MASARETETPINDGDYFAVDESAWIRVRNIAIRIIGVAGGVQIVACKDGDEANKKGDLDSMFVPYPD